MSEPLPPPPEAAAATGVVDRHDLSSWRTLLHSFMQLSTGEIVARVLAFAALLMMTRRLGPVAFGAVALGTALVHYLKLIADAGTETLNVRDIARRPHDFTQIAGPVLGLRLALSVPAVMVFALISLALVQGRNAQWTLLLFALALPPIAVNLRLMVLGLRGAKAVVLGNILGQLLFATGLLFLVDGPEHAFVVPLLLAASELLYAAVIMAFVATRFGVPRPSVDVAAWRATLRGGLPLMVNQLSRGSLQVANLLMIAVLLSSYWTGIYGAALRPLAFLTTLMALLSGSFLASYSAATPKQGSELFFKMMRTGVLSSIPLAVGLSIAAHTFMPAAFGDKFASGTTTLAILAWIIPLAMLGSCYAAVLIANDRQVLLMRHTIAAAAFNLPATLLLLPIAGVAGAALVTVLAYALILVLNHRSCATLGLTPPVAELFARALPMRSTP